jgi:hypothetical protein
MERGRNAARGVLMQAVHARCMGPQYSVILRKMLRAVDHLPFDPNDLHMASSAQGSFGDVLDQLSHHADLEASAPSPATLTALAGPGFHCAVPNDSHAGGFMLLVRVGLEPQRHRPLSGICQDLFLFIWCMKHSLSLIHIGTVCRRLPARMYKHLERCCRAALPHEITRNRICARRR